MNKGGAKKSCTAARNALCVAQGNLWAKTPILIGELTSHKTRHHCGLADY
jgi:hypothetical protein